MLKKSTKRLFVFYMFLVLIITLSSALIIVHVNDKMVKLNKENEKLKKEILDYKWQIEQVPYVIEAWCSGE